jgi:uncharacterized protein
VSANIEKALHKQLLCESSDLLIRRQKNTFINFLCKGGYLVKKEFDELEGLRIRQILLRAGINPRIVLAIAPTMACNLKCPYCYAIKKQNSKMSSFVCDKVVMFTKQMVLENKAEGLLVTYVGGEPLLALDIIEKLNSKFLEFCKENHCSYNYDLITNGVLFDEEKVVRLTDGPIKLGFAQITLDGPREVHNTKRFDGKGGTYDRILANIKLLQGKVRVSIRINCDSNLSVNQVVELINDLRSKGILGIFEGKPVDLSLAPIRPTKRNAREIGSFCFTKIGFNEFCDEVAKKVDVNPAAVFFPTHKSGYCGLEACNCFAIDSYGNLSKCWETVGNRSLSIGSVTKPLSLTNKVLRRWFLNDPFTKNSKCSKCKFAPLCMGGCPIWIMTQGRDDEECHEIKWNLETKIRNAAITYLLQHKYLLANTKVFLK